MESVAAGSAVLRLLNLVTRARGWKVDEQGSLGMREFARVEFMPAMIVG